VLVGHQIGAATAAFGSGLIREATGSYLAAFVGAGLFGLLAGLMFAIQGAFRRPVVATA
jgi:hypothetical protein